MSYFKHIFFVLAMIIVLPMVTACNEDNSVDYTVYYDWRDKNNQLTENLFLIQKDDAKTYFNQRLYSMKEPEWPVFYHYFRHANLDSLRNLSPRKDYRPYSTSTVSVHYTLYKTKSVMDRMDERMKASSKSYDEALRDLLGSQAAMDSIFFASAFDSPLKADTIESSQVAFFSCTPNSVITGWGDLLQQMYIGDNIVCMIPWFIAYGQSGSASIDPYSNLFFRIELCDITKWGDHVE